MTPADIDYPENFEQWPPVVRERWITDYHALYYPELHPSDKPQTDDE